MITVILEKMGEIFVDSGSFTDKQQIANNSCKPHLF